MIKKLVKHGNSSALILDKALLKILNLDNTSEVEISTDGKSLIITPVKFKFSDNEKIQNTIEEAIEKYNDLFKELAKL